MRFSSGHLPTVMKVLWLMHSSLVSPVMPILPITAFILRMKKFPSGLSLMFLMNLVSVFGPNIAAAIKSDVNTIPFFSYKMFTAVVYLMAAIFILILRVRLSRNIFIKHSAC
ncbi:unnamed protein product [Rhizopus stolonifer]